MPIDAAEGSAASIRLTAPVTAIGVAITDMIVAMAVEVMDVKERAATILGRRADVMTRDGLHPGLRKRIEDSSVRVF
jgi:predicted nucleotidyltransferase